MEGMNAEEDIPQPLALLPSADADSLGFDDAKMGAQYGALAQFKVRAEVAIDTQ